MASSGPRSFPNGCRTIELPEGFEVTRIHHCDRGPIWFGPKPGSPPAYRFDAPAGEFQTLYAAYGLQGAFVETLLRKANRIIARTYVEQRQWTTLRLKRPLQLVQLYGDGLIFHGVTNDICAGDDYRPSQALARDFFLAFSHIDGIAYRARHDNDEFCFAIFNRVAAVDLEPVAHTLFKDQPAFTDDLLRKYGAAWDVAVPLPDLDKAG